MSVSCGLTFQATAERKRWSQLPGSSFLTSSTNGTWPYCTKRKHRAAKRAISTKLSARRPPRQRSSQGAERREAQPGRKPPPRQGGEVEQARQRRNPLLQRRVPVS